MFSCNELELTDTNHCYHILLYQERLLYNYLATKGPNKL